MNPCMHAYIGCLLRSRPHRRIDHWRLTAMRFGIMSLFGGFPGLRTRGMVRAWGHLAGDSRGDLAADIDVWLTCVIDGT